MADAERCYEIGDDIMEEIASDLDITMEDKAWNYVEAWVGDDKLDYDDMAFIVSYVVDNWRYNV